MVVPLHLDRDMQDGTAALPSLTVVSLAEVSFWKSFASFRASHLFYAI